MKLGLGREWWVKDNYGDVESHYGTFQSVLRRTLEDLLGLISNELMFGTQEVQSNILGNGDFKVAIATLSGIGHITEDMRNIIVMLEDSGLADNIIPGDKALEILRKWSFDILMSYSEKV